MQQIQQQYIFTACPICWNIMFQGWELAMSQTTPLWCRSGMASPFCSATLTTAPVPGTRTPRRVPGADKYGKVRWSVTQTGRALHREPSLINQFDTSDVTSTAHLPLSHTSRGALSSRNIITDITTTACREIKLCVELSHDIFASWMKISIYNIFIISCGGQMLVVWHNNVT